MYDNVSRARDTGMESQLVQDAIKIVQPHKHFDYSSLRYYMQRCKIAVAVYQGVDDLPSLVAL